MRRTLLDAKNSRIPAAIGACASDPRFLQTLNAGIELLLNKGHWFGTDIRARFCVTDGCIVMPRQIATIEGIAVCGQPMTLRTQYFEFMDNGLGIRGQFTGSSGCCGYTECGGNVAIYRGRVPTFSDIVGVDKELRLVCDLSADVGKAVLCLGYDENLNWIRTNQGGTIKDGEVVLLAQAPGINSTHKFSSVTDLQPADDLSGQWWLYEWSTTLLTQRLIGHYDYDDTRPSYAKYFLPGIRQSASSGSTCSQTLIEVIGKLSFIPVVNDTDYLLIGNLNALKAVCSAINKSENEPDGEKSNAILMKGIAVAVSHLNDELEHYVGSGVRLTMNVTGSNFPDSCPVEQLV